MIKKIFLLLMLSTSILFASSFAKKYGYYEDFNRAYTLAKESKKDIVMLIVSDHCPWCEKLKEEVLSLEYTNEILHKKYIPLMVSSRGDYPSKYNSYVEPTIHFISYKNGAIIETVLGFNNNWRFYEIIEAKK